MTKGIRQFTNTTFNTLLPQLAELGNTEFRRSVMAQTMLAFEINEASAATHYNHALKMARQEVPEMVKGLGRPEDKKGGRKPVHPVDVIKVKTGEVVAACVSKAAAETLVAKAAAAKKAKLEIRVVVIDMQVAEAPADAAMLPGAMPAEAAAV